MKQVEDHKMLTPVEKKLLADFFDLLEKWDGENKNNKERREE